jgi:L-threonylcarbamoyladenylate synthase
VEWRSISFGHWQEAFVIDKVVSHLKSGGIIAYPTETVWGLGVDISNNDALKKLFGLKGRDTTKAISVLVGNIYQAKELAEIDSKMEKLFSLFWPGPVTFVAKAKPGVPTEITGGSGFVGLRCSNHPFVAKLVSQLGTSITSTSANKSGEAPAQDEESLLKWLPSDVLRVQWREDRKGFVSLGSTVVKIEGRELKLLRQGDMDFSFIQGKL